MMALTGASPVPPARHRTSRSDCVPATMVPAGAPSTSGSPARTWCTRTGLTSPPVTARTCSRSSPSGRGTFAIE